MRFGIQTSLQLPNDLLQPRISGIEKQNGTGIIYQTSVSENYTDRYIAHVSKLKFQCGLLHMIISYDPFIFQNCLTMDSQTGDKLPAIVTLALAAVEEPD